MNGHRLDYIDVEKELSPNTTACTCAPRLAKRLRGTPDHGDHIPILLSIHLNPWPAKPQNKAPRRLRNWLRIVHDKQDPGHQGDFITGANQALTDHNTTLNEFSTTTLDGYWNKIMEILMPIATTFCGAPKEQNGRRKELPVEKHKHSQTKEVCT